LILCRPCWCATHIKEQNNGQRISHRENKMFTHARNQQILILSTFTYFGSITAYAIQITRFKFHNIQNVHMCRSILNSELHSYIWVRSNLMAHKVPSWIFVLHKLWSTTFITWHYICDNIILSTTFHQKQCFLFLNCMM
jgi:hypothetical protein